MTSEINKIIKIYSIVYQVLMKKQKVLIKFYLDSQKTVDG